MHNKTGGWFNLKMPSYQYGKFHRRNKTILQPSHLRNGIFNIGKMIAVYWTRSQLWMTLMGLKETHRECDPRNSRKTQYTIRYIHMVRALFIGLGNHRFYNMSQCCITDTETIAVVSVQQHWRIWLERSQECNYNKTKNKITVCRAPSQYKDRLIYVWRFPC